jgi:hypothetical protein
MAAGPPRWRWRRAAPSGTTLAHRRSTCGWVLLRDPHGQFNPQALRCTDPTVSPSQSIAWLVTRWQVEVTFHEVRASLGVETQRQWSDLAILRTTSTLLGLCSLVILFAQGPPARPTPTGAPGCLVHEAHADLLRYPRLRPPTALANDRFLDVTVVARCRRDLARAPRSPHGHARVRRLRSRSDGQSLA